MQQRETSVCREHKHNTGDGAQALALPYPGHTGSVSRRQRRQITATCSGLTNRFMSGWGCVGPVGVHSWMIVNSVSKGFCPLGFWGRRVFSSVLVGPCVTTFRDFSNTKTGLMVRDGATLCPLFAAARILASFVVEHRDSMSR